jgi:hypothetical protein
MFHLQRHHQVLHSHNRLVSLHGPHIHTSSCVLNASEKTYGICLYIPSVNEHRKLNIRIIFNSVKHVMWIAASSYEEIIGTQTGPCKNFRRATALFNVPRESIRMIYAARSGIQTVGPNKNGYDLYCNLLVYLCSCIWTIFTYLYLVTWKSTAKQHSL